MSKPVIEAMLKRSTGPAPPAAPAAPASSGMAGPFGLPAGASVSQASAVTLATKEGEMPLTSLAGTTSSTYAFVTVLLFMDYPGLRAKVRTTDRRPSVILATSENPVSRYFLVKAEPDENDGMRSVKIGKAGFASYKGATQPDKEWTIPYEAAEEGPGIWRLTPRGNLKPGEYSLWVAGSGELFDFGVDK